MSENASFLIKILIIILLVERMHYSRDVSPIPAACTPNGQGCPPTRYRILFSAPAANAAAACIFYQKLVTKRSKFFSEILLTNRGKGCILGLALRDVEC